MKKVLSLTLAALFMAAVMGCGSGETKTTKSTTTSTPGGGTTTTTKTGEKTNP